MATVTKVIYSCDICKREFDKKTEIEIVSIPAITAGDSEGKTRIDGFAKVDMCSECRKRYAKVVHNNFAVVESVLGYITVSPAREASKE